ncbi:MAG: hypothetical protein JWN73_1884 [Betaproteobacteria bacterium]|nr:hypothetical protein [Betaproteobacteria bacterium]
MFPRSECRTTGAAPAPLHRHCQGIHRQMPVDLLAHGPADDLARVQVKDHRQVQPAAGTGNEGHVGQPTLVRIVGRKVPVQQVGRRARAARIGRYPEPGNHLGDDVRAPHQDCHGVFTGRIALGFEFGVHARGPVGGATGDMDTADAVQPVGLTQRTLTGRASARSVVSAGGGLLIRPLGPEAGRRKSRARGDFSRAQAVPSILLSSGRIAAWFKRESRP